MDLSIQIVEKPDWVSWDDIKQCLFEAHSVNRAKGINMDHYQWPTEKIKESLGENGFMLVALDGDKVVGTAGIGEKFGNKWYSKGRYAYMCFASVLPEYAGKGIYKMLEIKREAKVREDGYTVLIGDTHSKNTHRIDIALKNGFKLVRFFRAASKDHYNVLMVKWLGKRTYSNTYIRIHYCLSYLLVRTMYNSKGRERSRIITSICLRLNRRLKVM